MIRTYWIACITVLIAAVFAIIADDPPKKADDKKKPGFTISKETTYVTGPLREGGYIDYVAALNERIKQGVTPENNAMVLLVRALGPVIDGTKLSERYFKELGCAAPPDEGKYFRQFDQFLKDTQKPAMEIDQYLDYLHRLRGRPWSRKEFPDAAHWVDSNEDALRWARSASERTQFYSPAFSRTKGNEYQGIIQLLTLDEVRYLAELFLCRVMLELHEGKYVEAKQDILACHRLSRLVSRTAI